MALKPTIYKINVALSDLDRNLFETLNLTVAQHPSETLERMMVRVLAYCIHADPQLSFTKGLSEPDVPDLWNRTLDDQLEHWIDVGEPAFERLKKASRAANHVSVYSFNSKSDVWWAQNGDQLRALDVAVFQLPWPQVQQLAGLVTRTMDFSLTLSEGSAYFSSDSDACEVSWQQLC